MLEQVFEHGPFAHRQVHHAVAHAGAAGGAVEREFAHGQHRRRLAVAPRQCPYPRHQLGAGKRFDQVVVGAGFQPAHAVFDSVTRGEQQHRHPAAARAQPPHHFEAVHAGQADIEHHHLGGIGALQQLVGSVAVIDHLHRHPLRCHHAAQAVGNHAVVLHYQYLHGVRRICWIYALCARAAQKPTVRRRTRPTRLCSPYLQRGAPSSYVRELTLPIRCDLYVR